MYAPFHPAVRHQLKSPDRCHKEACDVVMQETVHQSPVFDCCTEFAAGQTEDRGGRAEGIGGGGGVRWKGCL